MSGTTHRGWLITPATIGFDIQHPDYDRENRIDWRHGHAETIEGARIEIDRLLTEDAEWTEASSIVKEGVIAAPASPIPTFVANEGEREALTVERVWTGLRRFVMPNGRPLAQHFNKGEDQIAFCHAVIAALSPALDNTAVEGQYVAGPIWREDEEEGECWTAEVQTVGGHNVVATVHGASKAHAATRQAAVIAALTVQTEKA